MRKVIILMIMAVVCLHTNAQVTVEKRSPISSNGHIELDLDFANNIVFKTWNKNEVLVKVQVSINHDQDNDKYELSVATYKGTVKFRERIKNMESLKHNQTYYDEDGNKVNVHCTIETDLQYEVYLPEQVSIGLESISGNIEGKGLKGNLKLKTISGDIDLAISPEAGANLEFSTISGEVYTDFNFSAEHEKGQFKHHFFNMNFDYQLNGGGNKIALNTISGNIFFRKL